MNRYTIGIILKPHGVRGAIKVGPMTDDVARFKSLEKVYIENKMYKVLNAQISPNEVILTLDGLTDRNQAELFRNKDIQVEKADAVKLQEGRYFIVDIVGCEVFVEDKSIGKVDEVLQNGAADVYVIKSKDKECMVPALKTLLLNVDTENKKIVLDKKVFEEVVVYEDWSINTISWNVWSIKCWNLEKGPTK